MESLEQHSPEEETNNMEGKGKIQNAEFLEPQKTSWVILSTFLQSFSFVKQLFLKNQLKFWWSPCSLLSEHFFPSLLALLVTSVTSYISN